MAGYILSDTFNKLSLLFMGRSNGKIAAVKVQLRNGEEYLIKGFQETKSGFVLLEIHREKGQFVSDEEKQKPSAIICQIADIAQINIYEDPSQVGREEPIGFTVMPSKKNG